VLSGAEAIDVLSIEGAMVPGPTSAEIGRVAAQSRSERHQPAREAGQPSAGQTIVYTAVAGGADIDCQGVPITQSRLRQMIFGA